MKKALCGTLTESLALQWSDAVRRNQSLDEALEGFRGHVWDYHRSHRRSFVWREINDPYYVFVSEVMLQQTQTGRVVEKFNEFIVQFSSIEVLANASLKQVLQAWQGLGYNRRARFLWCAAQIIVRDYNATVPRASQDLEALPGIGCATAGSIAAFAYNVPTVFIETNIRTVYLYFFFNGQIGIHDKQLMPLIEKTVDLTSPREWYYALMDYGVMLKKQSPNPSRASSHHTVQSPFAGSDRQLRGEILRVLLRQSITLASLLDEVSHEANRLQRVLDQLCREQLVKQVGVLYHIA